MKVRKEGSPRGRGTYENRNEERGGKSHLIDITKTRKMEEERERERAKRGKDRAAASRVSPASTYHQRIHRTRKNNDDAIVYID